MKLLPRAARLTRPSTLRSLVRELHWRGGEPLPPAPPTWPLPESAASLKLTWPDSYRLPAQATWVEPLRLGFETLVEVERAPAPAERWRAAANIVPFSIELDGRRLDAAIDYGADTRLQLQLVREFDVVFKMHYLAGGYPSERVVPGGFVPNGLALYRYLPRLRSLADTAPPLADVYGRFGGDKAGGVRRRAVAELAGQTAFEFRGGIGRVRHLESLVEAARARVCLDLPGQGPLCFRLVEYLAIGSAIVSPPPAGRLHVPLEENRHFVRCEPDFSDLVDVVAGLLRDPARLASLRRETRDYYDRFLDYRQLGGYYLATCLERL